MIKKIITTQTVFWFLLLTGLVFVVLRILGFIKWSWWLVMLPWWGGLLSVFAIFLFILIGVTITYTRRKSRNKRLAAKS